LALFGYRKEVKISKIIKHTGYSSNLENDIALLVLAEAVDLDIFTPACLPDKDADFSDQQAWVYGN
jgi:hypothetical protein